MHAGLLSEFDYADLAVEVFEEERDYKCSPESDISCKNNGITSMTEKSKYGFKFVDAANTCKYYTEQVSSIPFFIKYKIMKGKEEWTLKGNDKGIQIAPTNESTSTSMIVNPDFECGNSIMEFNIAIKSFTDFKDEYIGVVFRYLEIAGEEEFYLLKISKTKAILVKSINGVETDLAAPIDYNFNLVDTNNPGFYKFSIHYERENIEIRMQQEPSLDKKLLFNLKGEYSIKRGHVGFAKKGKPDVRIT